MALKLHSPLDAQQNEIQNLKIQNLSTDPTSLVTGLFWFNSATAQLKYYDGATVRIVGSIGKYKNTVGDGTSTSIVVTHNLNSSSVVVSCSLAASPNQIILVEVDITSQNAVTLVFATAPALNTINVTVIG